MDFLLGIVGADFVLTVADKMSLRSIMVLKNDYDKMIKLNDHTLMLTSGEIGDCTNFGEYVQKNVQLHQIRNGIPMTTHAAANFTRKELATALRSKNAYQVNLLIAGFEKNKGPVLYWMDYLSAMQPMPFGIHGYGAFFCLGLLDKKYKPGMNLEEAIECAQACILELRTRFLVNYDDFTFRVVDKDGVRDIETPKTHGRE